MGKPASKMARIQNVAGLMLLGLGILLFIGAAVYYGYGAVAGARANELTFSAERPTLANLETDGAGGPVDQAAATNEGIPSAPHISDQPKDDDTVAPVNPDAHAVGEEVASYRPDEPVGTVDKADDGASNSSKPRANAPETAYESVEAVQPEQVTAMTNDEDASIHETAGGTAFSASWMGGDGPEDLLALIGSGSEADDLEGLVVTEAEESLDDLIEEPVFSTRIYIPAIGVDSGVKELELLFLDEGTQWETPKHVVGHVPSTAGPGEQGHGWYVGHLESPLRGEGNVFSDLPDIPNLLKQGQVVDVFLEVDGRRYQYQVYQTEVLSAEELKVTQSGRQDITLVTCYPRLTYDKRLLVTAALVGVSDIEPS